MTGSNVSCKVCLALSYFVCEISIFWFARIIWGSLGNFLQMSLYNSYCCPLSNVHSCNDNYLFLCFKRELQVRLACNQHLISCKHTACVETLVYKKWLTIYGTFKVPVPKGHLINVLTLGQTRIIIMHYLIIDGSHCQQYKWLIFFAVVSRLVTIYYLPVCFSTSVCGVLFCGGRLAASTPRRQVLWRWH